jgi:hypothetical protein
VSDVQISKLMDSTPPSFGGAGDDLLIGGATSYDEGSSTSPISTGDLADWQSNYGTGGTAAAPYKMHLIRHTGAGSDSNIHLVSGRDVLIGGLGADNIDAGTSNRGHLMVGVDNVDLMFDGFDLV